MCRPRNFRKNVDVPAQDKAAAEEIQTRILDLIASNLTFEKLRPTIVKAYLEVFTEDEIDGILGFYQSPAGKAMLQKSPQLMMRMMGATQQQTGDIAAEIKKITEEVRAKYPKAVGIRPSRDRRESRESTDQRSLICRSAGQTSGAAQSCRILIWRNIPNSRRTDVTNGSVRLGHACLVRSNRQRGF